MKDPVIKNIIKSHSDFKLTMAQLMGDDFGMTRDYSYTNAVWPKGIYDLQLSKQKNPLLLHEIKTGISKSNLPNKIIYCPWPPSDGSHQLLLDKDFVLRGKNYGMALDLNKLDPDSKSALHCDIRQVSKPIDADPWARVVAFELLGLIKASQVNYLSSLVRELLHEDSTTLFSAYINNELVGTSLLFTKDGIAGIYLVSVDAGHRNKGIGRELTLTPCIYAKEKGYQQVVLQASELGALLYQKLGFESYCVFTRYILEHPSS